MQSSNQRGGRLLLDCGGGLGNQMFEYAAGLYFEQKFNKVLEVLKPLPQHAHYNGFPRPFQLNSFRLRRKVREPNLLDRIFFSTNPKLKAAQNVLESLLSAQRIQDSQPYHFRPGLDGRGRKDLFLVGNWQAAGYVEGVEPLLREDFVFVSQPTGKNLDYATQIQSLACPISLHLRIGDYATITQPTGEGAERVSMVLKPVYYERAIAAVRELFPTATLVVFSDDAGKARSFLAGQENCFFIEGNDFLTAHEDLRLMSLCRHHIIANSSFSWWGAWLNGNPQKRVFAPRYWGNTQNSWFPDLFPPSWTILDNLSL